MVSVVEEAAPTAQKLDRYHATSCVKVQEIGLKAIAPSQLDKKIDRKWNVKNVKCPPATTEIANEVKTGFTWRVTKTKNAEHSSIDTIGMN